MKVDTAIKSYVLYTCLIITLSATGYFAYQDFIKLDSVSLPISTSSYALKPVRKSYALALSRELLNVGEDVLKVDIFAIHKPLELKPETKVAESIVTTVAIPIAPTPPSVPAVPTLPFKYIGKIFGDDEFQVFMVMNGKGFIVKEGDIVHKDYKIDKISPPNMNITHIPSNTPLTMQIGEPN